MEIFSLRHSQCTVIYLKLVVVFEIKSIQATGRDGRGDAVPFMKLLGAVMPK